MARCKAKTTTGDRCKRDATHADACSIPAHQEQLAGTHEGKESPEGMKHPLSPPGNPDDPWSPLEGKCNAPRTDPDRPGLCRQPAGWGVEGITVGCCKKHGGNTPNQRAHNERRMAQEAVETYGLPREVEPHEALLEEIARTAGAIDWLQRVIRAMQQEDVAWGLMKETQGGKFGESVEWKAGVSVWVQLYQKERRHFVSVCKTAIACGIAEREIQLAEGQAKILGDVLEGVLRDLGLEKDRDAREAVRRNLTAIPGGKAA